MHSARPKSDDPKRDALLRHHAKSLERMHARFTGKVTQHWKDGKIEVVELNYKVHD